MTLSPAKTMPRRQDPASVIWCPPLVGVSGDCATNVWLRPCSDVRAPTIVGKAAPAEIVIVIIASESVSGARCTAKRSRGRDVSAGMSTISFAGCSPTRENGRQVLPARVSTRHRYVFQSREFSLGRCGQSPSHCWRRGPGTSRPACRLRDASRSEPMDLSRSRTARALGDTPNREVRARAATRRLRQRKSPTLEPNPCDRTIRARLRRCYPRCYPGPTKLPVSRDVRVQAGPLAPHGHVEAS